MSMENGMGLYIVDKKWLFNALRQHSSDLVGELCKQNEVLANSLKLRDPEDLRKVKQALELLKNLNKEKLYEASRQLQKEVKAYSQGTGYKIYRPTNHSKEEV